MNDVLPELSNVTIAKVHVQDSDSIIEINAKRGDVIFLRRIQLQLPLTLECPRMFSRLNLWGR